MAHEPPCIALTGATGFIGRHLLFALLDQGYTLRVLVREGSLEKRKALEAGLNQEAKGRLKWIKGDLSSRKALQELVQDAQRVVHLAGAIRGADFEEFARVNTKGLWLLIRVLKEKAHPPPLLFVSSLAARHPFLSPYAFSKRAAEEILYTSGLPWAIFRPPAVYGPGDRELRPLIKLMGRGIIPVLGRKEHRFSLLYVKDLVRAITCWLEKPVFFKTYELHDGEPGGYDWCRVGEIVQKIIKRPVRFIRLPQGLFYKVGRLNHLLGHLLAYTPMLTHWKVHELFYEEWICDNQLIQEDLEWEPLWGLEKGLRSLFKQV